MSSFSYYSSHNNRDNHETFLESFVESIAPSLPPELRRQSEHMRDLDRSCAAKIEVWRDSQDEYLGRLESDVINFFRERKRMSTGCSINRRKEKMRRKGGKSEGGEEGEEEEKRTPRKKTHGVGDEDECGGGDREDEAVHDDEPIEVDCDDVVPTTEELHFLFADAAALSRISELHRDIRKASVERVRTALQTRASVRATLARLDADLVRFERELREGGVSVASAFSGHAAAGAGMAGGALAMASSASAAGIGRTRLRTGEETVGGGPSAAVMMEDLHHRRTSLMGSTATATIPGAVVPTAAAGHAAAAVVGSIDVLGAAGSSLSQRHSIGTINPATPAPITPAVAGLTASADAVPGAAVQLAAIQVLPKTPDWILAKILSRDERAGMYTLSDEDADSDKIFTLPQRQVVVLTGNERWTRGDSVYAVYPDTTSFYHATVSQPPKNVDVAGTGVGGFDAIAGTGAGGSFVLVHFQDDGDEHGITHETGVPLKHVMRLPHG